MQRIDYSAMLSPLSIPWSVVLNFKRTRLEVEGVGVGRVGRKRSCTEGQRGKTDRPSAHSAIEVRHAGPERVVLVNNLNHNGSALSTIRVLW
jgi:hypothetical protein